MRGCLKACLFFVPHAGYVECFDNAGPEREVSKSGINTYMERDVSVVLTYPLYNSKIKKIVIVRLFPSICPPLETGVSCLISLGSRSPDVLPFNTIAASREIR